MIIKKKCWSEMFEVVLSGKKKFDLRLADFDCKEGDILVLEEWNPETKQYTGRKTEKKIGYVFKTNHIILVFQLLTVSSPVYSSSFDVHTKCKIQ